MHAHAGRKYIGAQLSRGFRANRTEGSTSICTHAHLCAEKLSYRGTARTLCSFPAERREQVKINVFARSSPAQVGRSRTEVIQGWAVKTSAAAIDRRRRTWSWNHDERPEAIGVTATCSTMASPKVRPRRRVRYGGSGRHHGGLHGNDGCRHGRGRVSLP